MSRKFQLLPTTQTVQFGTGILEELKGYLPSFTRPFVVSTGGQATLGARVGALLGVGDASCYFGAVQHTPLAVTDEAYARLQKVDPDSLVTVGGGSATGLGKALALRSALPLCAVPTTYAGSEMTSILGQSDGARKWTERAEVVRPCVVVYDVTLTVDLPARVSAASGANALAHAIEALFARDATPVHLLIAEEAIKVLATALPLIGEQPGDLEARSEALYGAFLAGMCLGACEMGLHHRLCHILGGRYGLAHAETHAIVLPQVVGFYERGLAGSDAGKRLARALEVESGSAAGELFDLFASLELPSALEEIGLPPESVEVVTELVCAPGGYSPRPLSHDAMGELLLARAARGARP